MVQKLLAISIFRFNVNSTLRGNRSFEPVVFPALH